MLEAIDSTHFLPNLILGYPILFSGDRETAAVMPFSPLSESKYELNLADGGMEILMKPWIGEKMSLKSTNCETVSIFFNIQSSLTAMHEDLKPSQRRQIPFHSYEFYLGSETTSPELRGFEV